MNTIILETNKGKITIETDGVHAVSAVENFLSYVIKHHFDGTIFHRVIKGFMIQGGHFDVDMKERAPNKAILNESENGLKNEKYTISMARTSDPHSATDQFFINLNNNGFLDFPGQDGYGYTVFGKVIAGQDIVDAIGEVPVGRSGALNDVPTEPVIIEKAYIVDPVTHAPAEVNLPITD